MLYDAERTRSDWKVKNVAELFPIVYQVPSDWDLEIEIEIERVGRPFPVQVLTVHRYWGRERGSEIITKLQSVPTRTGIRKRTILPIWAAWLWYSCGLPKYPPLQKVPPQNNDPFYFFPWAKELQLWWVMIMLMTCHCCCCPPKKRLWNRHDDYFYYSFWGSLT